MGIKPGDIALFTVSGCIVTDASKSTKGTTEQDGRRPEGCSEWSSEVTSHLWIGIRQLFKALRGSMSVFTGEGVCVLVGTHASVCVQS